MDFIPILTESVVTVHCILAVSIAPEFFLGPINQKFDKIARKSLFQQHVLTFAKGKCFDSPFWW